MVFQISHYSKCALFWLIVTYDNSWIGLAKLIDLLFPSIHNCFMCWLSFTHNEYILIIGSIKHWKSQCGKMQTRICHFYYVNINFKCDCDYSLPQSPCPLRGLIFLLWPKRRIITKMKMSVGKFKRPTKISRIKDFTSKTSKDWSEDSESDLKFNESIGSSYSCSLSDSSK